MRSQNKKIRSIAIIDSLEGYKKAYKYKPDIIVTDNILLYNKIAPNSYIKVLNTDLTIKEADINKWGKLFINWGLSLDVKLNQESFNHKLHKSIQEVALFSMFLLALICRVEGLRRTIDLQEIKKLIVIYSSNRRWHDSPKYYRFISPYPFLAENGFFGKTDFILDKLETKYIENINESQTQNIFLKLASARLLNNIIWKLINSKLFKFSNLCS